MFFQNDQNLYTLREFLKNASNTSTRNQAQTQRLSACKTIVGWICNAPKEWDDRCGFNIEYIGKSLIQMILTFNENKDIEIIDSIYVYLYRFLCEYDFLIGADKISAPELAILKQEIESDNNNIENNLKGQIIYATYFMPAFITKKLVNNSQLKSFFEFEQQIFEAASLKEQWKKEIDDKQIEVNKIRDNLDSYKSGFNFVGLNKGFEDLAKKKKGESCILLFFLIVMGGLIISPLMLEIYFSIKDKNPFTLDHLYIYLPLFSMEIILIYFFRIILQNHRSAKAQIMQLELRQALCQFIQSYVDYSTKIKKADAAALEKFENLIFSAILADPEKIPSTFDGIEQISKLVKAMRE